MMTQFYNKDGNPLTDEEIDLYISHRKTDKDRESFLKASNEVHRVVNKIIGEKGSFDLQDAKDLTIYIKTMFNKGND